MAKASLLHIMALYTGAINIVFFASPNILIGNETGNLGLVEFRVKFLGDLSLEQLCLISSSDNELFPGKSGNCFSLSTNNESYKRYYWLIKMFSTCEQFSA